ncbi:MAG TPA: hypothetical protein VF676_10540 [Flavobacterium sp.]|jgi:hypothetical protein
MNEKLEIAEELLEKVKLLAKTKLELYKLKAIDKGADVFASVATGVTLTVIAIFLIAMLSTGLALYLGELFGKAHHGFFAVAGLYAVFAILVILLNKSHVSKFFTNYIINQIFKDKRDASNKR